MFPLPCNGFNARIICMIKPKVWFFFENALYFTILKILRLEMVDIRVVMQNVIALSNFLEMVTTQT